MQIHTPLKNVTFCGDFGAIREDDGEVQFMYLGNGRSLKKGKMSLEADKNVYAVIYQQNGAWHYSSTGTVKIKIGKTIKTLDEGYFLPLH